MKKQLFVAAAMFSILGACNTQKVGKLSFKTPDSGMIVTKGQPISVSLNFPITAIDSVVYSVDGSVVARKTDTTSINIDTQDMSFGARNLSAKVYVSGKEDVAYSNVIIQPEAAKNYGFDVVKSYLHDENAFTQGLQYENGFFYESTGLYGESTLRKVDAATGKILKSVPLADDVFGEGLTVVDDKIVVLTWQNKRGMIFDKSSLTQTGSFDYQNSVEGWGLTYDGAHYIKSDGSNNLFFLDKDTFVEKSMVTVYDEKGPVDQLNELEFIDGKVYANVYQKDIIVIIDPKTGAVEGRINLLGLYDHPMEEHELNGIAYDAAKKRLFVTGKKWPKIYEIKLLERK